MARPTKYKKRYCDELLEYFMKPPWELVEKKIYRPDGSVKSVQQVPVPTNFPTMAGFATKIGVHRDTLLQWVEDHPEFSDAYSRARDAQEQILVANAMVGNYDAKFAAFFAKNNLGYRDKQVISTQDDRFELIIRDAGAGEDGG